MPCGASSSADASPVLASAVAVLSLVAIRSLPSCGLMGELYAARSVVDVLVDHLGGDVDGACREEPGGRRDLDSDPACLRGLVLALALPRRLDVARRERGRQGGRLGPADLGDCDDVPGRRVAGGPKDDPPDAEVVAGDEPDLPRVAAR